MELNNAMRSLNLGKQNQANSNKDANNIDSYQYPTYFNLPKPEPIDVNGPKNSIRKDLVYPKTPIKSKTNYFQIPAGGISCKKKLF